MIIEISIGIIALAFTVLVIYLVMVLKTLKGTLTHVNQTIIHARRQLDELGGETKKILEQTQVMGVDVHTKLDHFDSLFRSLSNIGDFFEKKTAYLAEEAVVKHKVTGPRAEKRFVNEEKINVTDILEAADVGIRLWQKLKKRR